MAAPATPLMELPTSRPAATARPTGTPTSPPTQTPTPLPGPTSEPVLLGSPPPAPLAWLDENGTLWWAGTDGAPRYLVDHVTDYAWPPDGSAVALLRDGDLWLLNMANAGLRLLLSGRDLVQIAWAPTAKRIACVEELAGYSGCVIPEWPPSRILLVDLPSGSVDVFFEERTPEGYSRQVGNIQWSADGRTLYATRCYAVTTAALLAIDLETGTARMITGAAWWYVMLPFRGTLLVAEHRYTDTGSHRVAVEYDPTGTARQEWPALENAFFVPGPDGTVAFTGEPWHTEFLTGTLYLLRPDSTVFPTGLELDRETRDEQGLVLDWSPDGRWLVVERAGEVWLVNAVGGEARPLVAGRCPRWCPGVASP
ncbi:MAG: hypothetical protein JXM73_07835 [Anaerolineae bacterium]|nr:hypothetical protein [Anaerolineae bacterium]